MAQIGQNFDATTVQPSAPMELLPADTYVAHIVASEMRPTKNGQGQFLWLEHEIIEGPYARRKFWNHLNLVNNNVQAVEIAQRDLSAICHATGQLKVSDSEQLHFKPMLVKIKVLPAGPDKQGVQRDAKNEVGGYTPLGRSATASAQAGFGAAKQPAQQTQQAPVQQQPQQQAAPPWRRTAAA